ncbi:hypothetical protein CAEBREN_29910 [Caenorhabditis brenneri]|uniref:Calmodulin-binding domain-containing protein n=1 Tax=Caenorhabditis brenneri TaxID=135651 RepID=G0PK52_CAEBE|nr:hypothetical protein CAEBREN_29910 [Caenorhabditis brenneri]
MLGSPVTDNPDDPLLYGGNGSAPKSILRAPRLTSAPKQLSFDVPASPTPTAKSSCVSTSGSYHMFERPSRLRAGKFSYGGLSSNHHHNQGHISLTANGKHQYSLIVEGNGWFLVFASPSSICIQICELSSACLPYYHRNDWSGLKIHDKTFYTMNVLLSITMFVRLYWLCRVMLLHSRVFTDASSRSIAGLNRVNFNARFILKTLMTMCPGTMLMIFTAFLWIIAGWILRLCEREQFETDPNKDTNNYINSIWLVAITFLSVGYGDIVPKTYCGRSMAIVTGILGTCASSMVVAVIARKLELTRAEKHVHNFMQDTQLTRQVRFKYSLHFESLFFQLKHSAANVLRETWFIFKYRKLVEKPDHGKIRKHTRKFLLAIYEMRRVRRDQRKLAENLVSLGDVAKTSSNTYELVHDVHSTQEGLSLRITAIEHQLSDISREISSLAELLRGSNEQRKKSVVIGDTSAPPTPQQILRRKVGELRV